MRGWCFFLFLGTCLGKSMFTMLDFYQNDYYGALDVEKTATPQEIKKAYRQLSLQL